MLQIMPFSNGFYKSFYFMIFFCVNCNPLDGVGRGLTAFCDCNELTVYRCVIGLPMNGLRPQRHSLHFIVIVTSHGVISVDAAEGWKNHINFQQKKYFALDLFIKPKRHVVQNMVS